MADETRSGGWTVGIDIGGTFTDVVAVGPEGLRHAKTPTTPGDPLAGLEKAIAAVDLDWPSIGSLIHGTTLVTNMLVEAKLARVALITTAGFEDVLHIARASRDDLYSLDRPPRLASLVPPELTFGITERMDFRGEVIEALSEAEIARAVAFVRATRPEAVAVSLLHAYANPEHEARLGAALREVLAYVSLSHEVSPEAREYERTASTALNAAVMPRASAYVDRLLASVPETTAISLFHSAGGVAMPAVLRSAPLALALSGPAAGAIATADVCRKLGIETGLAFDMGGTTTDVCLVAHGRAEIATNRKLGGRPVRQPMIAIETVGAGGGSLVRLGAGGLTIGPDSAGSDPGPASYGLGGTEPTITDANVLLGYLDPARRLGGAITVDPAKARQALEPIAGRLGRPAGEVALGVLDVANAVMARALRRVTVQRGVDLRGATLVAFGGAGPMHAVSLARQIGISHVLVPEFSSGFSAFGCIAAPPLMAKQKTIRLDSENFDAARLDRERAGIRSDLSAALMRSGVRPEAIRHAEQLLIRYVGQSVAVEVPVGPDADLATIGRSFREVHQRTYGYATDEPFQIESLRIEASAPGADVLSTRHGATGTALPEAVSVLPCIFGPGGAVATPRHGRETLPIDVPVAGPAVIEDAWSTVVLPPGATCRRDTAGHLHVEV
ncbi:hydantoinase/oxoprolinase family protein [Phreatobacter stygius]|uniref:Hydantoinase/oxoprolinase family protein n=1 Tax=Phreatobacter stygius TaxID=1940610 RepID=A0A4D7B3V8_9HYPH|nr:hydantoinase/oxoprolinase family protein [Phreatobacter stygius]QCI65935.1 hydantoinase/oxoprolinase family protein [Phreatobacter stygius]